MKPAEFAYVRPQSVADTVRILSESDECKVLAGGQSLVPLMNFRLAEPPLLVDVNGLAELAAVAEANGRLQIGALARTRQLELSPLVRDRVPVLAYAAHWVGHVQIRNRGTAGGSVAHADPAAELPAVCVLLGAEMTLVSVRGQRVVGAEDFFEGLLTTAIESDELLTRIDVPIARPGAVWGFSEYAQRPGDFALAGVACLVARGTDDPRLVAFGPSGRPMRCPSAEQLLRTSELRADMAAEVAEAARSDVESATEASSPETRHRVNTVRAMARKAVEQCIRRMEEQQ